MKYKGVSSRNKVLDSQLRDVKVQFESNKKFFIDKSENDDKYVNALKNEVQRLKKVINIEKNKTPEVVTRVVYKAQELQNEQPSLLNFSTNEDLDEATKVNYDLLDETNDCYS